ncbi:unnamed protein product [Bathycoccus prasinos]
MSDQPLPPIPPPPPGENEEDIPPPPPPPLPPADETVSLEIDFEKLAERAAVIAREQQQQHQHQQQKKRKQRDSPSGKKNIPPPPMPPVSLGGTVLDEVDLERIKVGDNRWGIALSSCVEYPNKKYFFSRKDSKVCQWETPKELKGGLQKNLRICPLEATLLPQNTMPESGWVELTTTTTNAASSIDKHNDNNKEGKKESRTEEEKTQTANAKSSSKKKYYWHPASKQVTWQRPRRGEHEVQEAEILPLQFISESAQ